MPSDTIDRIIESAESQARSGGYNAFSFREIAKDIGIKSASIHYHFPTKADLAAELTKRYTEKFSAHLTAISESKGSLQDKLSAYADLFYHALKTDKKMCLCALFAAEMDALPDSVRVETRQFFQANLDWLQSLLHKYSVDSPQTQALRLLANIEGAMIISQALESEVHFKNAVNLSID